MVCNAKFRQELKELLDKGVSINDYEICALVLDHIWEEWPRPFFIWLMRKFHDYDYFKE